MADTRYDTPEPFKVDIPERALIESWYFYPTSYTPDSTPYTLTNLVKRATRSLKGVSGCP